MRSIKKYFYEPLYRNSIAISLNYGFSSLFGLLFWIVASRFTTSKEIGLAVAIISVTSLISGMSRLGWDAGLIRYLPQTMNKGSLYNSILNISMILSLICAGVFLLSSDYLFPAFAFLKDGWLLPLFLAYILIVSITDTQSSTLLALRKGDLFFIKNFINGIRIPLILFIPVLGVFGLLFSHVIALALSLAFTSIFLYRYGLRYEPKIELAQMKNSLSFSLGNYLMNICSMASTMILPIVIISISGAENNAYFYMAYTIAGMLLMVPSAIATSLFVEGSHDLPLKENTIKSLRLMLGFMLPSILIIFLFGNQILLIFSKEFSQQSFDLLKLLAISNLPAAFIMIYTSVKKIEKDIKLINYISFSSAFLLIALSYIFLQNYGLPGVGYASILSNIIMCVAIGVIVIFHDKWLPANIADIIIGRMTKGRA